ncbi:MAG TPA: hypothetical protein VN493_30200 [Thermoanaerobaculia bacterium]|nr:hypothetical protein [Thermoanaerobaculia bacterium]
MAAPQTPPNLGAELLAQLRGAKSPLARVRVVARAWRALRSLPREQRLTIAAQIGLDGADDLVEAIAAHQGTTPPAELMGTLNNLQKVDPGTLKSLATKMRDPRQRAQVASQGLKALESALTGPGKQPAPPSLTPPKPPPPPVTVKPATSWPLREAAPAPPKPAESPAVAPPAPAPPAPAPAAPPVTVKEPPKPAPAPAPPAKPPEPPREQAAPSRGALAEALSAVPALTPRFRLLRHRIAEVRRLSPAELRGILEAFPDGWARRRVLIDLIEAGAPERTADALSLLDALQSPGDRSWCLGTLADTRRLSAEEQAALLQAAPTPAGRRRLELRLEGV